MADTTKAIEIDVDILKKCVASELGVAEKDVGVANVEITSGAKPGEGYMTEMRAVSLKATVQGKETQHEYIAKIIPRDKERARLVTETNMFDVESEMYTKLLRDVQKLDKKKEYSVATPACYFASKEKGLIVMENLRKKGFSMSEKAKGFDMDHIKLILVQFANLHACSYHLLQTAEGKDEGFLKAYPTLNRGHLMNFGNEDISKTIFDLFVSPFFIFLKVLKELWEKDESLVKRLEVFEKTCVESYKDKSRFDNDDFRVVNFGDCWLNNMMFTRDSDGKPLESKIYDLQTCYLGSPIFDLSYFFMSSVPPALRKEKLSYMMAFYHEQLAERLEFFGYKDVYSLEQLKKDYKDKYVVGFFTSGVHTQIALAPADGGEAVEMSKSEDPEEQQKNLERQQRRQMDLALNTPAIKTRMLEVAEEAMEMGLF